MAYLIEFPLEKGGSVVVEVKEPPSGPQVAASPGEIVAKARQTFDNALESIKPAAEAIIAKLGSLSEPPHEIAVEFGIKVSAQAAMIVASGGIEANYKITLKWQRE